jgi:hypothetical protein
LHRNSASTTPAQRPQQADDRSEYDISRRHALISIGKYAAYVTPAMTVLVRGSSALAAHSCNSGQDGQGNAHSCIP